MIFTIVSRFNQSGKDEAAKIIEASFFRTRHMSVIYNLNRAVKLFSGPSNGRSKYDKHTVLGVSEKQINHAISEALTALNPELPVHLSKQDIEYRIEHGYHVITSDTRRQREFLWLDDIAAKYDTKHHIIEIVPVGAQLEKAKLDTWSNGIEPCGFDVWEDKNRSILFNDGTHEFEQVVVRFIGPF